MPNHAARCTLLHDWMLDQAGQAEAATEADRRTRAVADACFYEALLALGRPRWEAAVTYAAVRLYQATRRR